MFEAPCEKCGRKAEMLEIQECAQSFKASKQTVYNRINRGGLHLMQLTSGRTVICKSKLHNLAPGV